MFRTRFGPSRTAAAFLAAGLLAFGSGAILRADAQTPAVQTYEFVPVTPDRVLDTRNGTGDTRLPAGQKVGAGETIDLKLADITLHDGSQIPASAAAVSMNITISEATERSFLSVYPNGVPRPHVSVLNVQIGEDVPNEVTIKLGSDDQIEIYNFAGSLHVIVDFAGYYVPAGAGGGGGASGDPIQGGPNDPTGPCVSGEVFLNTTTGQLFACVDGEWVPGTNIRGPAGPQGPAGPTGATGATGPTGQAGQDGVVIGGVQLLPDFLVDLALLASGTYQPVATFTVPADGDWLLEASVDMRFQQDPLITLGLAATAVCKWDDNTAPITDDADDVVRGASITAGVNVAGLATVPGLNVANIYVPASISDATAGTEFDLLCRGDQLLAINAGIVLSPAYTATQVELA